MRANGHIALTDFDLSKQAHAVSPRVVQQQLSLMDKMKHLALSKGNRASSALNLLDIVDSEPVLSVSTTSFVGTEEYISPEVRVSVHTLTASWGQNEWECAGYPRSHRVVGRSQRVQSTAVLPLGAVLTPSSSSARQVLRPCFNLSRGLCANASCVVLGFAGRQRCGTELSRGLVDAGDPGL